MSVNRHESELAENHAARLTAYALGQLEAEEQAEIERELAASPAARQTVESVRKLADHLRAAAQADTVGGPSAALRAAILCRLEELEATDAVPSPKKRVFRPGVRLLVALAACVLIAAIPVAWLTWLSRRPEGGALALFRPPAAPKSAGTAPQEALAPIDAPAMAAKSPAPAPTSDALADEDATAGNLGAVPERAAPSELPIARSERRMGAAAASSPADGGSHAAEGPMYDADRPRSEVVRKKAETFATSPARIADKLSPSKAEATPDAETPAMPKGARLATPAAKAKDLAGGPAAHPAAVASSPAPPAPPGPAEKPSASADGSNVSAAKPSQGGGLPLGRRWQRDSAGGPGEKVSNMPGSMMPGNMPGSAGHASLAEFEKSKAEPKAEAEGTAKGRPPVPRVSQALPERAGAPTADQMGTPGMAGSLGFRGGAAPGGYPGYPGVPAMAGRAAQAPLPTRGTGAISRRAGLYAGGLSQDTAQDAAQRVPLEAQSTRRAAPQRESIPSESAAASGRVPFSMPEVQTTVEHPFVEVGPFPVSPLPLEVDRAQYRLVDAAVRAGRWPRPETLDIHGLVNAFPYRDPAPPARAALAVGLEVAECPWKPGHRLVRVAVAAAGAQALASPTAQAPPRPTRDTASTPPAAANVAAAKPPATDLRGAEGSLMAAAPVVARDVRILVEFNPLQAAAYRLIGADLPAVGQLAGADGAVSAATLRSGDRVIALYQVVPPGAASPTQFPQLRYQRIARPADNLTKDAYSGQLLTVHVQYREAATGKLQQSEFAVRDAAKPFAQASADLRFAAAVAAFGMLARNSPYAGSATLDWVEKTAAEAARDAPAEPRTHFVEWVRKLRGIPAQ